MMKIRRKKYKDYYFDVEKEENWLNEMSKKGLVLNKIDNNYYYFDECNKQQYSYKIDILKDNTTDDEVKEYFSFLKELDIEIVYNTKRWLYLRKEVPKAEFVLYSDKQSLIDYYKRYNFLRYLFAILFFIPVITYTNYPYSILLLKLAFAFISLLFLFSALKIQKKISEIRNNQKIYE